MQKINNIEIKNFKSIRQTEIKDCRKVNVFVGPPNVGKSNILEALGLFGVNQIKQLNELVRLKEIPTIFFNGVIENNLMILLNESCAIFGEFVNDTFSLAYQTKPQNENKFVRVKQNSILSQSVQEISYRNNFEFASSQNNFFTDRVFNIKKYEFKKDIKQNNNNRSFTNLEYPFGENIFSILQTNEPLNQDSSDLLKIYNLELLYDNREQQFTILKRTGSRIFTVPYELLADTLQRLIFYKAAILSNKETILLFEEPEANCYEPYIMEITNAIKNDENDNQFFIVTHSQYVIDELMRDKEYRDNVNIYLVGLNQNNETEVKLLKPEVSEENYKTGLNIFFNFNSLWNEN